MTCTARETLGSLHPSAAAAAASDAAAAVSDARIDSAAAEIATKWHNRTRGRLEMELRQAGAISRFPVILFLEYRIGWDGCNGTCHATVKSVV